MEKIENRKFIKKESLYFKYKVVRLVGKSENGEEKLDCRNIVKEEMIEFCNSLLKRYDIEENVKVSFRYFFLED